MIKFSEIKTILKPLKIRVDEYKAYIEDEKIETPFIVYTSNTTNSVKADGTVFFSLASVKLLLIVDDVNDSKVNKLQDILIKNNISFIKEQDFNDEDRVFEILYSFEAIDG